MIAMPKAQASIEYLLLLAAVLFFFSLMIPLLQQSHELAFFAVDIGNAKSFANELQYTADSLAFLSNGSAARLEARPVGKWIVSAKNSTLTIIVESNHSKSLKSFSVVWPRFCRGCQSQRYTQILHCVEVCFFYE
ncbi:MAG: hypothetical protein CL943_01130 [Candidatus Diapherotrites archaeon]|uniref:Class III signal peptide-containing protein n=1 Tax=Candidatus Iainarchaeum sp. TaxID=3101447 RepID=A0A2D6M0D8_9ARCH|nr:hypothetical protein [Candidatus Diapherotrites archaeon]